MIVIDASVVANALADDERDGDVARERIARDPNLHAPHLMDAEVMSVLRKRSRARIIAEGRAAAAVESLSLLRVARHPHGPLLQRMWELRANATPYDAAYLALAETLGCLFVTSDAHLATVPSVWCQVEILR